MQSVSSQVFDELFITIESIGIDKTVKSLKEARVSILSGIQYEYIIKIVSEVSGVSINDILNGTDRSDERKMAVSSAVYFVKEEFPQYSFNDLVKIFGKDSSGLWRYHKNVFSLPKKPKTDFDKRLSELVKSIGLKITSEKNKL